MEAIFYEKAFWVLLSSLGGCFLVAFKMLKDGFGKDIKKCEDDISKLDKRIERSEGDIRNIIIADKYRKKS